MENNIQKLFKSIGWIDLLVFGFSTFTYFYIFKYVQHDIRSHILVLQKNLAEGSFPVPPLYYFILWIFGGFTKNLLFTASVAFILLGLVTTLKFKITQFYFNKLMIVQPKQQVIITLSISMLIIMSIFSGKYLYIGELSPNVWHNSTTIFLLPFALLLYFEAIQIIKGSLKKKNTLFFISLIIINALIKPSFLFVFSLLPVVYFFYYGWNKKTTLFVVGGALALCIVVLEYVFLFLMENDPYALKENQEKNSILFKPLHVWTYYSKSIVISIISGLAMPIGVLVSKFNLARKKIYLIFAWVQLIAAVLIYALFTESGYRMYDGNLAWQIIPSLYILFMASLIFLYNEYRNSRNEFNITGKILLVVFALHVLSGIYYIGNIYLFRTYY